MNEIYIHDSLSNQKKKFEPIDSNNIRMYACVGPLFITMLILEMQEWQ